MSQLTCYSGENIPVSELGITSSDLAYVIYTSGSTGQPKGVECHSQGIVNLMNNMERLAAVSHGGAGMLWTSLSFDASVYEVMSAICYGHTLQIVDEELRMQPQAIFEFMVEKKISCAYLPPFFIADFVSWLDGQNEMPKLQRLSVGVEAIPLALLKQIQQKLPQITIINGYGPAEMTICSSFYKVTPTAHHDVVMAPIGHPVDNSELWVLNPAQTPVPVGVVGELYIGGVGLARGYLGQPELSAQKFVTNPFYDPSLPNSSQRLYRTGDLAYWLADGNLVFCGRNDNQVKIRGFRIELQEIECAIKEQEGIDDAVVIARDTDSGVKQLVAYVVATHFDVNELRKAIGELLPAHMVPNAFVMIAEIPLSANDKVDRKALPEVDISAQQVTYQAPTTATENILGQIWQKLLGLERVGIDDNFFALGGHSLHLMHLSSQIQLKLQCQLPVSALYSHGTIKQQAAYIESGQKPDDSVVVLLKRGDQNEKPLFLIHAIGGSVGCYGLFASELDYSGNIYGIQLTHKDDASLEQMAQRYVFEIAKYQAQGPYRLAGWSMGGVIAYEMTQHYEQLNVEYLIMIDSLCPLDLRVESEQDWLLLQILAGELGIDTREIEQKELLNKSVKELLQLMLEVGIEQQQISSQYLGGSLQSQFDLLKHNKALFDDYKATKSDQPIHFIQAIAKGDVVGSLGWEVLVPQVNSIGVVGDHFNLMKQPQVKEVATIVKHILK